MAMMMSTRRHVLHVHIMQLKLSATGILGIEPIVRNLTTEGLSKPRPLPIV